MCKFLAIIKNMECCDLSVLVDVVVTGVTIQTVSGQVNMNKDVAVFLN